MKPDRGPPERWIQWSWRSDRGMRQVTAGIAAITATLVAAAWIGAWNRISHERQLAHGGQAERAAHLVLAHERTVQLALRALDDAIVAEARAGGPDGRRAPAYPQLSVATIDADGRVSGEGLGVADEDLRAIAASHRGLDGEALGLHAAPSRRHPGQPASLAARRVTKPDGRASVTLVVRYAPQEILSFQGVPGLETGDALLLAGTDGALRAIHAVASAVHPLPVPDPALARAIREVAAAREEQAVSLEAPTRPVAIAGHLYALRAVPGHPLVAGVVLSQARIDQTLLRDELEYLLLAAALSLVAAAAGWATLRGLRYQRDAARSLRESERRHLDLLGMAADWFWHTDANHRLTRVSCSARHPVSYPARAEGSEPWALAGTARPADWCHAIRESMTRHEPFNDLRLEHHDAEGRMRIAMVCGRPVLDDQGRFLGYHSVGHDVTAQLEAQKALRASEERLSSIIESAMDAIVICDASLRIIVFNEAASRMFGRTAEQAVGAAIDILLPARFRAAHEHMMRQFGKNRATPRTMGRGSHVWALRANGEEFPVDASISHVEVGDEPLYAVVMRDITSRLASERALRESEQEQRRLVEHLRQVQKVETLGAIAGGIAHDFNNVVAAIMGNTRLARSKIEGQDAGIHLDEIERASLRARELVRRIMSFSRQEGCVFTCQPVGPLVEEAVALLRATLPAGVHITLEGAEGPWLARVDGTQIHQLVMNLGTNAWQALGGGNGTIAIRLSCDDSGEFLRLCVMDDGVGMDEATRQRMFEPFFTTKAKGQGTGLGLAVVQEIVKGHGGSISVKSRPGAGCAIDVCLPFGRPEDGAEGERVRAALPQPQPPLCPAAPPAAHPAARAKPHVVVVDDYDAMLLVMQATFEAQGLRVTPFNRSAEALAFLQEPSNSVDLVVTDQDMPQISGIDLTRAMRAEGGCVPVIIASGYLPPEVRAVANDAGATHLFDKQAGADALVALVHEICGEGAA